MAAQVELFRDEFATYTHDDQRGLIEQRWSSATKSMSEQQFRDGVAKLAYLLEQAHAPNVLVDITVMGHSPSGDFESWRQAQIIPRYNAAGVEKFAFLMPSGAPGTIESGTEPAIEGVATFPTGYFSSRDRALRWFETGTTD
jgi:hypothetical protein